MIGNTFGDFEAIKQHEEYLEYKNTDRGYLVIIEGEEEAKAFKDCACKRIELRFRAFWES